MRTTVNSAALAGAVDLIESHGVDASDVAKRAGLSPNTLSEPDIIIDAEAVLRFFEIASTACDNRYLGLELARYQGFEVLGPVWLLARHAQDLQEAFANISQTLQLRTNAVTFDGVSAVTRERAWSSPIWYKP